MIQRKCGTRRPIRRFRPPTQHYSSQNRQHSQKTKKMKKLALLYNNKYSVVLWLTEWAPPVQKSWQLCVVNNCLQHVDICRWCIACLLYHFGVAVRSTFQLAVRVTFYYSHIIFITDANSQSIATKIMCWVSELLLLPRSITLQNMSVLPREFRQNLWSELKPYVRASKPRIF